MCEFEAPLLDVNNKSMSYKQKYYISPKGELKACKKDNEVSKSKKVLSRWK